MTYSQNPSVLTTELPDDEVALLDTVTQHYYTLNGTGGSIWSAFERSGTIESAASALVSEYEVDGATALESVRSVVDELVRDGLLVAVAASD